jgi:hypothetical protein
MARSRAPQAWLMGHVELLRLSGHLTSGEDARLEEVQTWDEGSDPRTPASSKLRPLA